MMDLSYNIQLNESMSCEPPVYIPQAVGVITAFCDYIIEHNQRYYLTRNENLARNKVLRAKLQYKGYQLAIIKIGYIKHSWNNNPKIDGFFVINKLVGNDCGKLEQDLVKLGEEFNQDSIISKQFGKYPNKIHMHNPEEEGQGIERSSFIGSKDKLRLNSLFALVRDKSFKINSIEEVLLSGTINGRLGIKLLSEKNWRNLVDG